MKKMANKIICNELLKVVSNNNGIPTIKAIDLVMQSLASSAIVAPFLVRQRVAGDVSALVTKFMYLKCVNSCLYI